MDADLGTVLAVHNQFAAVRMGEGDGEATIAGRLRRARPVVGDLVRLHKTPDGSLRIEEIEERRGMLMRAAFRERPQVVAANVDLLVIVAATADPPLRANLIDRYLVAAWRGGIETALALTKLDLPHDAAEVERVTALLRSLGHAVIEASIPARRGHRGGARADRTAPRGAGRPLGRRQDDALERHHRPGRPDGRGQRGHRPRPPDDDGRALIDLPGAAA